MARGDPAWVKGVSGNPRGLPSGMSVAVVYDQLLAEFVESNLSAADKTMPRLAAQMVAKASRTRLPDAQTRLTNTSLRIIGRLRSTKALRRPRAPWGNREKTAPAATPRAGRGILRGSSRHERRSDPDHLR
jgi:hypothetical protein